LLDFQKDGLKEIENMQAELTEAGYKRSVNNLFAVYMKNKNFLNYNPACTAQDLQAIMADHYENIEESIPSLDFPPLRKMKSAHSDEKIEMSRSSSKGPERIESAKMRMDDSLTLKKKSTSVKRTGHPVDEALFYQNYKPKKLHTSSSLIFQQRPKKERKSHATKGKFPLNFNYQDKNLLKNIEIGSRSCGGKNSKKSNFYFNSIATLNNKEFSTQFLKYLDCEMIYSSIDQPFFQLNDFSELLKDVNENEELTKNEWSMLRSCMGKPRRFSNKFINEEREKLNRYRNLVRSYLYDKIHLPESRLHPDLVQKIKRLTPLQVSQVVLAVHPVCHHIHPGSIMTITGSHVIIKFYPMDLGAMSVSDAKIITIPQDEGLQIIKQYDRTASSLTTIPMNRSISAPDGDSAPLEKKVIEDLDYSAFSLIIKMLERKTALVNELRALNNLAESDPENLNEKMRQEYGWTGVQIKLLDNALKHAMTKYRLRGTNNYDLDQVTENLENLLRNPIRNVIESTNRKDIDQNEANVIKEIKGLLNKTIEEKISTQIKGLTEKFSEVSLSTQESRTLRNSIDDLIEDKNEKEFEEKGRGLDVSTCERSEDKEAHEHIEKTSLEEKEMYRNKIIDDVDNEKKDELKGMVKNIMGVLFSLKYQGELNMTENKYLTELHTAVFEENPDEFHEINTVLLNICSR